jgi:hypothetical protein
MGKSLLAETLTAVLGSTAVMSVTDASAFNSMSSIDLWTRTFLVVQEVAPKVGRDTANYIKTMTGGKTFNAARKGQHFKEHSAPANLVMLSNNPPQFIESTDRRFFVSEWSYDFETPKLREEYMGKYYNWLRKEGGFEAIAALLRNTNVSKYDQAAAPLRTMEWELHTGLRDDEVVTRIKEFMEEHPQQILFIKDIFKELFDEYQVGPNAIKHKLEQAGLLPVKDRVKDRAKKKHTVWIRDGERIERLQTGSLIQSTRESVTEQLEQALKLAPNSPPY